NPRDLRRRRGGRRSEGGAGGDHRVPPAPQEVPGAGGEDPAGRAPGRTAGKRQDAAGEGDRRRGRGPVLLDLRERVCGNVRRRGTGRTSWIRRCCGPGGSTGGSWSTIRTRRGGGRSWACTSGANRSGKTPTWTCWRAGRRGSAARIWPTW